jgi:MSHA pilin protein MshD
MSTRRSDAPVVRLPRFSAHRSRITHHRTARGATLVEVVLFLVIVSFALTSILGLLGLTVSRSADPLIVRQSLAVAESLLQEIESQPFTTDDPDGGAEAIGPETGEARGSATTPFDHINDYHGYSMNGIVGYDGTAIPGLEGYNATVQVAAQSVGGVPGADGLLITVTVTGPGGNPVTLTGYRTRY